MADEEVREAEDQLARANIGGHKNGGPEDHDSEDTSKTDDSPESNEDATNPGSDSSLEWHTFDVKLIFLNGDKGKPSIDTTESLNEIVCGILRKQKNITALAVVENGGRTREKERKEAIGKEEFRYWKCQSWSFGEKGWDGITIYYNTRKIDGDPVFNKANGTGHFVNMKATIRSSRNSTTVISVTVFHGPHTKGDMEPQFTELRDLWNAEKLRTGLAVVLGDFNRTLGQLQEDFGIIGFPAFKPKSLKTRAKKKPGDIDNALSNITRYKRSIYNDNEKLYHQIGIVRYRWAQ